MTVKNKATVKETVKKKTKQGKHENSLKNLSKNKGKFATMSKEALRKAQSKGGTNSIVKRKQRLAMKEVMDYMLMKKPMDNVIDEVKRMFPDLKTEEIDAQMVLIVSALRVGMRGQNNAVQAMTFIRDTVGEKPVEVIQHDTGVQISDKLMKKFENMDIKDIKRMAKRDEVNDD